MVDFAQVIGTFAGEMGIGGETRLSKQGEPPTLRGSNGSYSTKRGWLTDTITGFSSLRCFQVIMRGRCHMRCERSPGAGRLKHRQAPRRSVRQATNLLYPPSRISATFAAGRWTGQLHACSQTPITGAWASVRLTDGTGSGNFHRTQAVAVFSWRWIRQRRTDEHITEADETQILWIDPPIPPDNLETWISILPPSDKPLTSSSMPPSDHPPSASRRERLAPPPISGQPSD